MLRQALVVGINNYPGLRNLKTPANDAEQIADLLRKHGGFQVVKRLPVINEEGLLRVDENPSPEQLVTSAKLKEAIAELFNPQGNDVPDTALLYFAGHGLRDTCGGITEGFLATSDANPRKSLWGVSLNWLQRLLQSSPVKEQIIWLDCCYSGELLNGKFLNFEEADPGERGQGRSRCFIAACGDALVAYGNAEHGILTSLLLKALDPQSREVGQWMNNYDLAAFIIRELENNQVLQTFPQLPLYNNSGGDIKLIQGAKQSRTVVVNPSREDICPYKGLAAFDFNEEDPKYFYGRTTLTDELLEKLWLGNFLAVVGASGSGKSSVVKAGLLYQLKLGQRLVGSNKWKILPVIRPGESPLQNLAEAFVGRERKTAVRLLKQQLQVNGAEGLKGFISEDFEDYSRVVLVVDQFEEAFTLCQDVKERQQFFDCLLGALDSSNNKLCLVITMRADFFGECAVHTQLAKQIQQHLVTVTPMTTEELTDAIREPALQVGLEVEEALVTQMIADVQKAPGNLPLLQFTLMELWRKCDRIADAGSTEYNFQKFTLSAYKKMGGVIGALNRYAQQIYNYTDRGSASPSQKRQPQEQELIRRIFLKLVRTGEGVKDTRQPQPKTKLMAIAGEDLLQQEVLSQLIEELVQGRLLVTPEVEISSGEYDLAHEALMSGWEAFAQWREKYRQLLRLRDRVDDALRVWDANGKKNEDLIMGGLLGRVRENWLDLQLELDVMAKEFYQRSDRYEQEQTSAQRNLENFLGNQAKTEAVSFNEQQSELERKIVISIIGTSLLERQFDPSSDTYRWQEIINKIYNYTYEEVYNSDLEALDIIDTLKQRATKKLNIGDVQTIRRNSSELNVIYALYNENLEQGKNDLHFCISSDTALGHATSDIIYSFLRQKGFNVTFYQPGGFSMISHKDFLEGIDEILIWLDEIISSYKKVGYKVCFNLVGAPNILQAYMDMIGMLYADELIYLFEGIKPTLVKLPKFPIQIDTIGIDPMKFALMEVGSIPLPAVQNIPHIFIFSIDNEAILSNWGTLIWKKYKYDFLSLDLLIFPRLHYEESFRRDYNKIRNVKERVKLQETLAKVSYLLTQSNGDNSILKIDNSLKYRAMTNFDCFRVGLTFRISCKFSNNSLWLRNYGSREYVLERLI